MQGSAPRAGSSSRSLDAAGEPVLPLRVLPVQDRSRLRERRGGDHQAVRLDEAEPFEVGAGVGVGGGHVGVVGLSVLRRAAKIPHAEQLPVRWPDVLAVSGDIDSPAWDGNDVPVPEIVHQQVVVREEQTCPACDGERQDVFVVGSALTFSFQSSLYGCNSSEAYLQDQPRLDIARIPFPEPAVCSQFIQKVAANRKRTPALVKPIPETSAGVGLSVSEHLERYVVVDDTTHQ